MAKQPSYTKEQRELAVQHNEALLTLDIDCRHVKGQKFGRLTFTGPWPEDLAKDILGFFQKKYGERAKRHKRKPSK